MRNFKKYTLANLNKEMKVMFNRIYKEDYKPYEDEEV